DVLLVRLGVTAVRGGRAGDPPPRRPHRAAGAARVPDALAPVAARVPRAALQAARRPLLAGPHVPPLPPRDPADAEPVELVLPPPPRARAQDRGCGQPFRAAPGAVLL